MYMYQADLWCNDCGDAIRERLQQEGKAPDDSGVYDSEDYPISYPEAGESDCPQHCAAGKDCINAHVS